MRRTAPVPQPISRMETTSISRQTCAMFCAFLRAPNSRQAKNSESWRAQRIVPPVVKVNDCSSSRLQTTRYRFQQHGIVPFTADERVQAKKPIKGLSERWSKIIDAQEKNVLQILFAGLAGRVT